MYLSSYTLQIHDVQSLSDEVRSVQRRPSRTILHSNCLPCNLAGSNTHARIQEENQQPPGSPQYALSCRNQRRCGCAAIRSNPGAPTARLHATPCNPMPCIVASVTLHACAHHSSLSSPQATPAHAKDLGGCQPPACSMQAATVKQGHAQCKQEHAHVLVSPL